MAEYGKSDEGGTGEASGQNDFQSFDELSRTPSEEECDIDKTESSMCLSKPAAVLCSYVNMDN